MGTKERIFELADQRFPEQQEFALAIGVTPSIVSQWRSGVTKSYERRLSRIAEVLETTVEYLDSGKKKESTPQDGPSKNALLLDAMLSEAGIDIKTMTDEERQRAAAILKAAFQK